MRFYPPFITTMPYKLYATKLQQKHDVTDNQIISIFVKK